MMIFRLLFRGLFKRTTRVPRRDLRTKTTVIVRSDQRVSVEPAFDGPVIKGRCWVVDGDTIHIRYNRIRLAGIDAPELDMPWGQKSKWALFELCRGQTVTAQLHGNDRHGRLVATCWLPDGRDLGAEMVSLGLALDWRLFSGGKYSHLEPHYARSRFRGLHYGQLRIEQLSS